MEFLRCPALFWHILNMPQIKQLLVHSHSKIQTHAYTHIHPYQYKQMHIYTLAFKAAFYQTINSNEHAYSLSSSLTFIRQFHIQRLYYCVPTASIPSKTSAFGEGGQWQNSKVPADVTSQDKKNKKSRNFKTKTPILSSSKRVKKKKARLYLWQMTMPPKIQVRIQILRKISWHYFYIPQFSKPKG